jgi:branched-chain amino acid aminotransferase
MPDGPRFVWLDGGLRPAGEASVSVFDRGLTLGDGAFETLRARGGRAVELAEHLARLRGSARTLRIELPDDVEVTIGGAIETILSAEHLDGAEGDAAVRVTVTRGATARRGLLPSTANGATATATVIVQAWPHEPPAHELLARGLRLALATARRDPLDPLAAAKTTSRAQHMHARLAAEDQSATTRCSSPPTCSSARPHRPTSSWCAAESSRPLR